MWGVFTAFRGVVINKIYHKKTYFITLCVIVSVRHLLSHNNSFEHSFGKYLEKIGHLLFLRRFYIGKKDKIYLKCRLKLYVEIVNVRASCQWKGSCEGLGSFQTLRDLPLPKRCSVEKRVYSLSIFIRSPFIVTQEWRSWSHYRGCDVLKC